jgi:hypothetical protein
MKRSFFSSVGVCQLFDFPQPQSGAPHHLRPFCPNPGRSEHPPHDPCRPGRLISYQVSASGRLERRSSDGCEASGTSDDEVGEDRPESVCGLCVLSLTKSLTAVIRIHRKSTIWYRRICFNYKLYWEHWIYQLIWMSMFVRTA